MTTTLVRLPIEGDSDWRDGCDLEWLAGLAFWVVFSPVGEWHVQDGGKGLSIKVVIEFFVKRVTLRTSVRSL